MPSLPSLTQVSELLQREGRVSYRALKMQFSLDDDQLEALKDELNDYDTSKGTIRFQAEKPLPVALVRKVVKARIKENVGRDKSK